MDLPNKLSVLETAYYFENKKKNHFDTWIIDVYSQ